MSNTPTLDKMEVCLAACKQIKKANRTKEPEDFFKAMKLVGDLIHLHDLVWVANAGLFSAANEYILRINQELAVYKAANKELRKLYHQVHQTASVEKPAHGGH